ncbi:hypothetical protein DY000_02050747 [Brassica cretica]|uniref:Uncharacterized protein n=1 Tax=Brassica cretica TaxID=69181 RepID=A0ABQ7ET07_BRACR|nr:hypothetical protein DY000_02050747 [Brassica cretica]
MGLESCLRSLWAVFRLDTFITISFDKERTFRSFDENAWTGVVLMFGRARSLHNDRTSTRARSLRSDRAGRALGRYVATELWLELRCYVATERDERSVAT